MFGIPVSPPKMSCGAETRFRAPSETDRRSSSRRMTSQRSSSASPSNESESGGPHGTSVRTLTVTVSVVVPAASVTVSVASYVPGSSYVWVGLTSVEVAPSPKSHA